jgi:integrase
MSDTGIDERHGRGCKSRYGQKCNCTPRYQVRVYDRRTGRRICRAFPMRGAAETFRMDAKVGLRRGEITATPATVTIGSAVSGWLVAAERGTVRTRSRKPFAPGTIRSVEQNYRLRIKDRFGVRRLARLTLLELQEFVDELDAVGLHPSTIEATILLLRLVYRRARGRGEVQIDPTDGIEMPEKPGTPRKPPAPDQITALLDAVPAEDRAVWATFMLTGVRRGELLALRWEDVDLDAGTFRVERSYTPGDGYRPPKSRKGVRTVPVGPTLAGILREHRLLSGRRDGLVFGRREGSPLDSGKLQDRADEAWKTKKLMRVTPHVCRHLYASVMAAAGVRIDVLSRFMGHSSITVTIDRYGHLFPGDEAHASTLQEAFLAAPLARSGAHPARFAVASQAAAMYHI